MNKLIQKIKNIFVAIKILAQYSDIINRDYFLKTIDNDIKNIGNLFNNTEKYDLEFRQLKLTQLQNMINELLKRNDPELINKGYSIYSVIDYYKKEYLYLIVNCIQYLNPIYDIVVLNINDSGINIIIDSWVNTNDMTDILDKIYNSDYSITYNIQKVYSKNRIGFSINIETNNIYKSLEFFITELNNNISLYIKNIVSNSNYYQKKSMYKYINNFNIDISILEKLEYGSKKEILSILKSHYSIIKNI